jgi:hypothetical protein
MEFVHQVSTPEREDTCSRTFVNHSSWRNLFRSVLNTDAGSDNRPWVRSDRENFFGDQEPRSDRGEYVRLVSSNP